MLNEHVSLYTYNTFAIEAKARYFATIQNLEQLRELLKQPQWQDGPCFVLGGGSNILLGGDFPGVVAKIDFCGITLVSETDNNVLLKAGSGVGWHDLVRYAIQHEYAGLENLSLIPGTVGAAPVQNIGAYGAELKDVFDSLTAFDRKSGRQYTLTKEECAFGYRDSVFKNQLKDSMIITDVTFRLSKKPEFKTDYSGLQAMLNERNVKKLTLDAISQAVIRLRQSKLPDPKIHPNAGSFFKNPVVSEQIYLDLKQRYETMPHYVQANHAVKIPAGWMIEQRGWRGKRVGRVGVYPEQALVLVNYAGGSGQEIYELSTAIQDDIRHHFGIQLEREVQYVV